MADSTQLTNSTKTSCCCRCNRTGKCKNCHCVKQGTICTNCLPLRLGNCENHHRSHRSHRNHVCPNNGGQPETVTKQPKTVTNLPESPTTDRPKPPPSPPASTDSPEPSTTDSLKPPTTVLPPHEPMPPPRFSWGEIDSEAFIQQLNNAYTEVTHWRRNIFTIPTGKAGKEFVRELSRLFRGYAEASALESIALKAASVLCILLLQKPSQSSNPEIT